MMITSKSNNKGSRISECKSQVSLGLYRVRESWGIVNAIWVVALYTVSENKVDCLHTATGCKKK